MHLLNVSFQTEINKRFDFLPSMFISLSIIQVKSVYPSISEGHEFVINSTDRRLYCSHFDRNITIIIISIKVCTKKQLLTNVDFFSEPVCTLYD